MSAERASAPVDDERVAERFGYEWYRRCVELAWSHPTASIENRFWWSCRWQFWEPERVRLWARDPERALEEWYEYFVGYLLSDVRDAQRWRG